MGEKVVKAGEVGHVLPGVAHYGRNASDKLAREKRVWYGLRRKANHSQSK